MCLKLYRSLLPEIKLMMYSFADCIASYTVLVKTGNNYFFYKQCRLYRPMSLTTLLCSDNRKPIMLKTTYTASQKNILVCHQPFF